MKITIEIDTPLTFEIDEGDFEAGEECLTPREREDAREAIIGAKVDEVIGSLSYYWKEEV